MRPHRRMKNWRAVIGDDDSESDDEEMVTWRPARGSLVRRRRGAVIYDSDNDGENIRISGVLAQFFLASFSLLSLWLPKERLVLLSLPFPFFANSVGRERKV